MQTVKGQNGIARTYGDIEVSMLLENELKKGVYKAQLKQTVTTTYPSSRVQEDLFSANEFTEMGEGKAYDSTRTALIDVPKGITKEQVQNRVNPLENAVLWKRISNKVVDVLTANQKQAIADGLQTQASYEAKFLIRTKEGNQPERNGVTITEYQQHFFSPVFKADEDMRTADVVVADFELVGEAPAKLTDISKLVNGKAVKA